MPLRRAGTIPNSAFHGGPGSAKQRFAPHRVRGKKRDLLETYSDAAAFMPPFDTATSAGRSTRSPMV
jgi:hypothetical protein